MIFIIAITRLSADLSYLGMVYAEPQQEQISEEQNYNPKMINEGIKKNVFYSLVSINSSIPDTALFTLPSSVKSGNNTLHNIELEVVVLPTGMPAYKLISHIRTHSNSSADATNI